MTTKQRSDLAASLQAELASIQKRIAALTSESIGISPEAVKRFTLAHWVTLQSAMIVDGRVVGTGNGMRATGKLATDHKGYALVKGVDVKWYMAVKGFAGTLRSRAENELPVELNNVPNDKGRTQVQYAQETLQALVDAKFLSADSPLLKGTEPKARKSRKS